MIFAYDKDTIYFATDAASLEIDKEDFYYENPIEENLPCWHPHDGMFIYVNTRNSRLVDLIRYYVDIPKKLSFATISKFYEDICEVFAKNGYTSHKTYRFDITVADGKDAYYLNSNGITDRDDKQTVISGNFLLALSNKIPTGLSPVEKLKAYYHIENNYYKVENTPILVFSTDKNGVAITEL